MLVVIGATLLHGFVTLPILLVSFTKIKLPDYYRGVREALITALSTSSSSATLPITYRCLEENLNADKDVAGFVLPLGATINMDGTAMYEAVAAIFVANLSGVELHLGQQLIVFVMAILASIGAPGIPSAGMVTMVMVLQSVGLPAEAIAILLPVDRLLDSIRTMVNVKGDTIGTLIVDHQTT
ncbi:MAG: dicarboxylate/amino acid:cation symporter [Candidatus Omnitrophica bacterium]|nr:dicarboxylate/amino acid:cation symporter [Candidatus Omnitrophota bacterium]